MILMAVLYLGVYISEKKQPRTIKILEEAQNPTRFAQRQHVKALVV